MIELVDKKGLVPQSDDPFKGNFDLARLRKTIKELGPEKVAFVRVEAGTNLIGGQPVSLENMLAVTESSVSHVAASSAASAGSPSPRCSASSSAASRKSATGRKTSSRNSAPTSATPSRALSSDAP